MVVLGRMNDYHTKYIFVVGMRQAKKAALVRLLPQCPVCTDSWTEESLITVCDKTDSRWCMSCVARWYASNYAEALEVRAKALCPEHCVDDCGVLDGKALQSIVERHGSDEDRASLVRVRYLMDLAALRKRYPFMRTVPAAGCGTDMAWAPSVDAVAPALALACGCVACVAVGRATCSTCGGPITLPLARTAPPVPITLISVCGGSGYALEPGCPHGACTPLAFSVASAARAVQGHCLHFTCAVGVQHAKPWRHPGLDTLFQWSATMCAPSVAALIKGDDNGAGGAPGHVLDVLYYRGVAQTCPHCGMSTTKTGDCTHMSTCCGRKWCYVCEEPFAKGHRCPLYLERVGGLEVGGANAELAMQAFHLGKMVTLMRAWLNAAGLLRGAAALASHPNWGPIWAEHATRTLPPEAFSPELADYMGLH